MNLTRNYVVLETKCRECGNERIHEIDCPIWMARDSAKDNNFVRSTDCDEGRTYVAVDALLSDDVIEAAFRGYAGEAAYGTLLPRTHIEVRRDIQAALGAAVNAVTGNQEAKS